MTSKRRSKEHPKLRMKDICRGNHEDISTGAAQTRGRKTHVGSCTWSSTIPRLTWKVD